MSYRESMMTQVAQKMAQAMMESKARGFRILASSMHLRPVRLPIWQRVRLLFGKPMSLTIDMEGTLYRVDVTVG